MKKILIIEDDIDMVEAIKVVLGEKYKVIVSFDEEDGYKKIIEEKPDLIILDVMFGPENKTKGFDLAIRIRQNKEISYIPILMLTAVNIKYPGFGFSPEKDREFLPVDKFIEKPFEPKELIKSVEGLLEERVSKWKEWPFKGE
jgi:DNA-binding response OmpR family regulator